MGGTSISEYRKFIFSLCEELSISNLHSMKFLCRDLLTTRELEAIGNSVTEFVVLLEQRKELGSENFHLLEDLLKQIRRQDLARKLKEFKRKQHRESEPVVDDKPMNRFLFWKCNQQDDVTDAKLPAFHPVNNHEDDQQAGVTPRDNRVMLKDVSADMYEKLGFLLNPASFRGSWIHLAGELGYTNTHVANFKLRPMRSTQMMLEDWAQREDASVFKLYRAVKAIGREDAARELESVLVPFCTTV